MRKLCLFLFASVLFLACSKKDESSAGSSIVGDTQFGKIVEVYQVNASINESFEAATGFSLCYGLSSTANGNSSGFIWASPPDQFCAKSVGQVYQGIKAPKQCDGNRYYVVYKGTNIGLTACNSGLPILTFLCNDDRYDEKDFDAICDISLKDRALNVALRPAKFDKDNTEKNGGLFVGQLVYAVMQARYYEVAQTYDIIVTYTQSNPYAQVSKTLQEKADRPVNRLPQWTSWKAQEVCDPTTVKFTQNVNLFSDKKVEEAVDAKKTFDIGTMTCIVKKAVAQ
jgi:hypothetical protein